MLQIFKHATTRRVSAWALALCLVLGLMAGPLTGVLSVKAESTVNVANFYGWTNEDTLGWTTSAPQLTAGETYTVSFLWKAQNDTYFYVNSLTQRVVEGMYAELGAIDYTTGRVTCTFTAAEDFSMGVVLNSASSGYGEASLADVKIVDAAGETVYTADTTIDAERGWGWTGWNNRWDNNEHTLTCTDQDVSVFAGEACVHEYDDEADIKCNICGAELLDPYTVNAYEIHLGNKSNGDGSPVNKSLTFPTETGKTYTFKAIYKHIDGPGFQMQMYIDTSAWTRVILMNGATVNAEAEGVTYDPETMKVTYTFTAATDTVRFDLASVNLGDTNKAQIANPVLIEAETGAVTTFEDVEGGWATTDAFWNAWPADANPIEGIERPIDPYTTNAYEINLGNKSGGDGSGVSKSITFATEVDKTYTFEAIYKHIDGPGFEMGLYSDTSAWTKHVLMTGTTASAATYDPDTLKVSYAFTATTDTVRLDLLSVNLGDTNKAQMAYPVLIDETGAVITPNEDSLWATTNAFWNAWPADATPIDGIEKPDLSPYYPGSDVNAWQINACYKANSPWEGGTGYRAVLPIEGGKTYTFKAVYKHLEGPGFKFYLHDGTTQMVLMNGSTAAEGVTYNENAEVSYTFTAAEGATELGVTLWSVNKGDNNTAQIANVRVIEAETEAATALGYEDNTWALQEPGNAWPNSVSKIEGIEKPVIVPGGINDDKMVKLDVYSGSHAQWTTKLYIEKNTTYTYSFYWRGVQGDNVAAMVNAISGDKNLIVGNAASDDVTYDPNTGLVTYTFNSGDDTYIQIGFRACQKNVPALAYYGAPKLIATDEAGTPVEGAEAFEIKAFKKWDVYDYPAGTYEYTVEPFDAAIFVDPQYKGLANLTVEGFELGFDPLKYVYEVTVAHNHGPLDITATVGEDGASYEILNNVQHAEGSQEAVIVRVTLTDGNTLDYTIYVNTENDPNRVMKAVYVREWNQTGSAWTNLTVKPNVSYAISFLYKDVAGGKVEVVLQGDAMAGLNKKLTENGKATVGVAFDPDTGRMTYVFTPKADALGIGVNFDNYAGNNTIGMFEAYIADFQLYEVDADGNKVEGSDVAIDNTFTLGEGAWEKTSYGGGFWNVEEVERDFFKVEYALSLRGITIDDAPVANFHPANYNYYYSVPYTTDSVTIAAELGDDGESIVVEGPDALVEGDNVYTITVTNYDQSVNVYTIVVTQEEEPGAFISGLTVVDGTLSPAFDKDVFEYTATVPYKVEDVEFTTTLSDNGSIDSITGAENLKVGIPAEVIITVKNGKGALTSYKITVTRQGKESSAVSMQDLVNKALDQIEINDYTTKEELTAALVAAINDSAYNLAVVDFYRLRSVTEVKDNFGTLIEGKVGYLAAVINISDGESLAQVTATKEIPYETKEYTFTEDEVSTEEDFVMSEGPDGLIVDFYIGDAKKVVIPDGVVEVAYGWLDPQDIEAYQVLVFPDSVTTIPDDMLLGSYGLETIVFGDGMTELSVGACAKLPNLQFVRLPETLETINGYAFDCSVSLASIRIPESVKEIGANAFGFTLMREVTVPAGVEVIGDGAFSSSFSAAGQLYQGSDNTVRWYPFADADDPRIAIIGERADKEIDWYGTKPNSPVWDTLAAARDPETGGFGKDDLYGHLMSSPKVVTVLNKDVEIGKSVFSARGLWCDGGNTVSIAAGAASEGQLQAEMDSTNANIGAQFEGMVGIKWGTRDMALAEVAARAMFALDKAVIGGETTANDLLAAIAPDYFTTQVTAEIKDFALDLEAKKATGTLVLKQGNVTVEIAVDKDVDTDYVAPEEPEILVTIIDESVISIDEKTEKLVVKEGATLAAVMKALKLSEGVEIDFYDEKGNYIAPEYYDVAVIREGFVMKVLVEGEEVLAVSFAVKAASVEGDGEGDNTDDNKPEDNKPEDNKPEDDKTEDDKTEDEDSDNSDTGVTSVAAIMIVLMAGAAVALLALRRRKVTE